MKKLLAILAIMAMFVSCQKQTDIGNIWGVKVDKDIYFTININGKTLTSYGAKFSIQSYQDWAFKFLYASTYTFTDVNQAAKTETSISINPLYDEIWGWGQYGLPNGQVDADFSLVKSGTILGTHAIDEYSSSNTIVDKTNGTIEYSIVPAGSYIIITEVNEKIIKGTCTLRLKLGSQITVANGSFRLWKLN